MRIKRIALTAIGMATLATTPLYSTALFVENFNYEDGELQTSSSNLWAPTPSDDANPNLEVRGGALEWDFTGESAEPLNNGYYGVEISSSAISAGNLYAQFVLTATTAPTSSNLTVGRFASFWNGSGGYRGRLWIGTGFDSGNNPVPGTFRLGVTEAGGSRNDVQWHDGNFDENIPVAVVLKYNYDAGSVSLFLNPTSEDDPHIEVDDGSDLGTKGFAFRHKDESTASTNLGVFRIDDLAVSTTFGDTSAGESLGAANLVAAGVPEERIFLSWEDRSFDETNFRVERRETGGETFSEIGTTSTNRNYFIDTTSLLGTEYEYQVVANNGADLDASNIAAATLFQEPPFFERPELELYTSESGPIFSFFEESGGVYRIEKSNDLRLWQSISQYVSHSTRQNQFFVPMTDNVGTLFFRVRSTRYSVPLADIGLQNFEQAWSGEWLPPLDITDFGATPNDDSDDDAMAIRDAIAQAQSGGNFVLIPMGTFHIKGTISIPSTSLIFGVDKAESKLMASNTSMALKIEPGATNIVLSDFGIDAADDQLSHGIHIGEKDGVNAERILIRDLEIQNFSQRGIQVRNANHVKIEGCYIHHATNLGGGGFGYGIALNDSNNHNNWITDCVIGPVIRHGVLIQFSAHHNLVENNTCFETTEDAYDLHGEDEHSNELRFNLAYWDNPENIQGSPAGFGIGNTGATHDNSGPNNWIHHNEVYGYDIGLEVIQQSHIQFIDGNRFYDNASAGIKMHDGGGNGVFIRGNTITGNPIGISATRSGTLTIEENQINENDLGLLLTSDIDDYTVRFNDLTGNTVSKNLGSDSGTYEDNLE